MAYDASDIFSRASSSPRPARRGYAALRCQMMTPSCHSLFTPSAAADIYIAHIHFMIVPARERTTFSPERAQCIRKNFDDFTGSEDDAVACHCFAIRLIYPSLIAAATSRKLHCLFDDDLHAARKIDIILFHTSPLRRFLFWFLFASLPHWLKYRRWLLRVHCRIYGAFSDRDGSRELNNFSMPREGFIENTEVATIYTAWIFTNQPAYLRFTGFLRFPRLYFIIILFLGLFS